MAFQQFRLGDLNSIHQPIIQQDSPPTHTTFPTNPNKSVSSAKQPYGSGDSDDGYTLVFANLQEFQAWREQEEERNMVEFVKVSSLVSPLRTPPDRWPRVTPTEARRCRPDSKIIQSSYVQGTPGAVGRSM